MKRNHLIALGAAVLVVGLLGFVVYRRNRAASGTKTLLGSGVPPYVPTGSFNGPPLPAANKISNTLQDVNGAVQSGLSFATTAKKTWSDAKSFFG